MESDFYNVLRLTVAGELSNSVTFTKTALRVYTIIIVQKTPTRRHTCLIFIAFSGCNFLLFFTASPTAQRLAHNSEKYTAIKNYTLAYNIKIKNEIDTK